MFQGYFHALPGTRRCGKDQNPATYMLDLIGAGIGHSADRDFGVDYRESSLCATNCECYQDFDVKFGFVLWLII